LRVEQSALWGLGRVAALEHAELWGGLIDLDPASREDEAETLCAELVQAGREDHLAFRGGARYVARLVQSKAAQAPAQPLTFSDKGSFLITGGLGGLGLQVARWLVERGARHLVLVGRSDASEAQSEAVRQMELTGARVRVLKANISLREGAAGILESIDKDMPPLRGIIHAAGVIDDALLRRQDRARFVEVMSPKVRGAWNLHLLTRDRPLDFFVLFSSAASLLGSPGQGNYAAANAFMDALAHYRRGKGLAALSVSWGPWADVGMAASMQDQTERRWSAQGIEAMTTAQGLLTLNRLLQQDAPHVGVFPFDWAKFMQLFGEGREPTLLTELRSKARTHVNGHGEQIQSDLSQRLAEIPPEQRHDFLVAYIRGQLVNILGLDPNYELEPHRGFFDLGIDSLMALDMKNRLQTALGFPIPTTLVFEYPTVEGLADYLLKEMSLTSATDELQHDPEVGGNGSKSTLNELPSHAETAMPTNPDEHLLANIERLSDEEVNALLNDMLIE
jgi:NAD(P)-dependent dehydrogenase (short-subunit alcohol dehydrogenase family)/acyl carrier protein